MKIDNVEQKSRQTLLGCFQAIPFLDPPQEETNLENAGADYVFRIVNRNEQTPYLLAAEVKDSGWPRFIQEAAGAAQGSVWVKYSVLESKSNFSALSRPPVNIPFIVLFFEFF